VLAAGAVDEAVIKQDDGNFKVLGHSDYSLGGAMATAGLIRADKKAKAIAASLAEGEAPTNEQMLAMFHEIGEEWPTQVRHNVTPNGKPVRGMCLGAVHVMGKGVGEGMQVSSASKCFRHLTQLATRWVRQTLPDEDYPFSSLQINFNYRAKRHVDGNNIGPSFIQVGENTNNASRH
jgi:hypothetical protein